MGKGVEGIGLAVVEAGRLFVPKVFADGEAQASALIFDDEARRGRDEVAVFVKNIVIGKEALPGNLLDASVSAEGEGVVEGRVGGLGIELGKAEDGWGGMGQLGNFLKGFGTCLEEARPEEEIAGRVAGDGQLGEDDKGRTLVDQLMVGVLDEAEVTGQVSDDGVDLSDANFHLCWVESDKDARRSTMGKSDRFDPAGTRSPETSGG